MGLNIINDINVRYSKTYFVCITLSPIQQYLFPAESDLQLKIDSFLIMNIHIDVHSQLDIVGSFQSTHSYGLGVLHVHNLGTKHTIL